MSKFFTKQAIYIWIIVILAATNISTILTIYYHSKNEELNFVINDNKSGSEVYNGRYFKDKLHLTSDQMNTFRPIIRSFRQYTMHATRELADKRMELINEMKKNNADTAVLRKISTEIGDYHTNLKIATYQFYLDLKKNCNDEQKMQLDELFVTLFQTDDKNCFPGRGQNRHHRNSN